MKKKLREKVYRREKSLKNKNKSTEKSTSLRIALMTVNKLLSAIVTHVF